MAYVRSGLYLKKFSELENTVCVTANRLCHRLALRPLMRVVSRLGDGVFWYVLMALIPIYYGANYAHVSLRMALAGAMGLLIYKLIKHKTARLRPCEALETIQLGARMLDKYSFPSGHTLHAVTFSLIVISYLPGLYYLVIPFATLVALSRVLLGLHYPTDVAAGASIGFTLAAITTAI